MEATTKFELTRSVQYLRIPLWSLSSPMDKPVWPTHQVATFSPRRPSQTPMQRPCIRARPPPMTNCGSVFPGGSNLQVPSGTQVAAIRRYPPEVLQAAAFGRGSTLAPEASTILSREAAAALGGGERPQPQTILRQSARDLPHRLRRLLFHWTSPQAPPGAELRQCVVRPHHDHSCHHTRRDL